jgi:hypothetical protein
MSPRNRTRPSLVATLFAAAAASLALAGTPGLAQANYRSVLDDAAPYAPAEVSLEAGRLSKLPVSTDRELILTALGAHQLGARVVCASGDAALVVVARRKSDNVVVGAWFNADRTTSDKNAEISVPAQTVDTIYHLAGYSQTRATATCHLEYRRQAAETWTSTSSSELGGTLVEVGPMRANAFLEVFSFGPGPDSAPEPRAHMTRGTRMIAFGIDRACTGRGAVCAAPVAIESTGRAGDLDPRVTVGAGWETTRNFVLVAKENATSVDGPEGVETRVQLVHGPLDAELQENVADSGIVLEPGRYTMWIDARTLHPAGDRSAYLNPSADLPGQNHICRGSESAGEDGNLYARGELNENLFTMTLMHLVAGGPNDWFGVPAAMKSRKVPLGALGSDGDWSRFYFTFEVPYANYFWITTEKLAGALADVEIKPGLNVVRNADVSELKVATWNMLYKDYDESWSTTKYQNAANLLASRGIIDVAGKRVLETADQGPFEWDADIVSLQETVREADVKTFRDEAARNSQPWEYSLGMAENAEYGSFATRVATMIDETFWPAPSDNTSIWFKQGDKRPSGCTGAPGEGDWVGDQWIRCHLPGHNGHYVEWEGIGTYTSTANYTIPAKAQANRPGGVNRPVAVFSIHLNSGDASGADERLWEMNDLINKMKAFRTLNPGSFFNALLGNADESTRIIVLGDTNMYTHECGEHYNVLRRLREEFGYAVDVAMADEESASSAYGMHNYGAQTVTSGASTFVPTLFQRISQWTSGVDSLGNPVSAADLWTWDPDPAPGATRTFPWWARTFRGRTNGDKGWGDRHDLVILVGKGWLKDDPVASYAVMQDHVRTTPDGSCSPFSVVMNGQCRGVELFHDGCSTGGPGTAVPDVAGNYRPHHAMCAGYDQPGKPAMRSDHRPAGVRLRIFGGGSNPR